LRLPKSRHSTRPKPRPMSPDTNESEEYCFKNKGPNSSHVRYRSQKRERP